ncbi:pyrroline-5-carboxylate reductase [Lapidilactobacillus luobeiensis]|uniref:pyrroline-5-carboxylate reductase n=1 Tax=Lapidilactobacillus luobeiensis TaxID=2950371 RepID=UPI0021C34A61|nr:pyrroline-5-carboxylate reductase [Lapidilactobacillus luobeiensis]
MKLGFIGVGHMAQAIILGLLEKETVPAADILVHSAHPQNYESFANKYGLQAIASNLAVVQQADALILAVKPQQKDSVLAPLATELAQRELPVFSLLSGVDLATLEALLGANVPIVRVMPNLNVRIGQGMTALAANEAAGKTAYPLAQRLFSALGTTVDLPEADFSTFVALAGSAPAFVYLFIDALAHAGVKYGLTKQQAQAIVSQMVVGSAQMVQQSDQVPWELIDAVASPGGTTIAGILALQAAGFETALTKAVDATIAKDQGEGA